MKLRSKFWCAFFAVVLGMVAFGHGTTRALTPPMQEPPLRLSEPTDSISADLESFIPDYMQEQNIPGVAIALIRDGEIVWSEGFGVANVITREPVTPEMAFEVASNSKVVTAYIALQLVDQGVLALDEPLNAYLPEPWLPDAEYRDTITLRHVLSHSSGLGQIGREIQFPPGSGYFYSPSGYLYLQEVIEQVTGQSLEDTAQEMVFIPLGMSSSSFVNPTEITQRTSNGHVLAVVPMVLFTVLYVVALVIVGFIGLTIMRVRTGQWRPTRRMVMGIGTVAFVLVILAAFVFLSEIGLLEFAWLIALCGFILVIAGALVFTVSSIIIRRLSPARSKKLTALAIVISVLSGCVFACSGALWNLPVPRWPAASADAAGSLRAPVGDMAAFLLELSNPHYLSDEMATQMGASQVRLSSDLSWGLGPGIQHSQQGDALWQWGQHIDFQSVMIIYPEHGFGVVVCTNSDLLSPDVAVEIAHRALGGKIAPIRQAINLDFNYRAEN